MSAIIVGGAVIGAAGSAYAANQGGKASQAASNAQTQTALQGMALQDQQYRQLQGLMQPFAQVATGQFDAQSYLRDNPDVAADPYYSGRPEEHFRLHGQAEGRQGNYLTQGSLGAQKDLVGLNGADAQRAAIAGIENSPYFSGLVKQGENAILQNASATGGLRGGNTQGALAQFRPNMLAAAIDQQYQRLGGLTTLGQNAAAGVATGGQNFANNSGQLLGQIGSAQAGGILGQARANVQGVNGLASAFGTVAPVIAGAFNSSGGGITGGAPTAGTPYGGGLNNNFGGQPVYF